MSDSENLMQFLREMEERLNRRLDDLERKMEMKAAAEEVATLGRTTNEIAVGLEDKAESGYVVLESLFHGLEDRMTSLKQEILERMELQGENIIRFQQNMNVLLESFNKKIERDAKFQEQMLILVSSFVEKSKNTDSTVRFHWERIRHLEEQTDELANQVEALRKKVSGDDTEK